MEQQKDLLTMNFDSSREQIRGIAQWARINAILAFVGLVVDIFRYVKESNELYRSTSYFGFRAESPSSLAIQVGVSILLNIILLMAGRHLLQGIDSMDRGSLAKGFGFLRTYYKVYGILTIIVLIIMVLFFIFMSSFRRY